MADSAHFVKSTPPTTINLSFEYFAGMLKTSAEV